MEIQSYLCKQVEAQCKRNIYKIRNKQHGLKFQGSSKLLDIDEEFNIFQGVKRAVDLYASNDGIWTRVLSKKLDLELDFFLEDIHKLFYRKQKAKMKLESGKRDVAIVAVSSCEIPSYAGVVQIDGNLARFSTAQLILKQFNGNKVDLVVCNKLIKKVGLHILDVVFQANHLVLIWHITCHVLQIGGTLVAAIFRKNKNDLLKLQLSLLFETIDFCEPKSSIEDEEVYVICRNYAPPKGFDPKFMMPYLDFRNKDFSSLPGINKTIIPLLICGDVSYYPLSPEDRERYTCFVKQPPRDRPLRKRKLDVMDHCVNNINEIIDADPNLSEMDSLRNIFDILRFITQTKDEDDLTLDVEDVDEKQDSKDSKDSLKYLIQEAKKCLPSIVPESLHSGQDDSEEELLTYEIKDSPTKSPPPVYKMSPDTETFYF